MGKKAGFTIFRILLLVLIVFISGCQGGKQGQQEPTSSFVATGTQALQMRFLPNLPPDKAFTQTPLDIMVDIRNVGSYEITAMNVYLTGFDPNLIPIFDTPKIISGLEPRSRFNPEGGYDTVSFPAGDLYLPPGTQEYNPTFLLTACYPYSTVASPMVCVDPNPTDVLSDKPCIVQNVGAGSQGAPIAVTNVEVQATPREMLFRIHVQNSGSGIVIPAERTGSCMDPPLQFRELNEVEYSVEMGTGTSLNCQPENARLRLVDNQGTIFCRMPHVVAGSAFETPLRVRLDYGYKESISQQIHIENIES